MSQVSLLNIPFAYNLQYLAFTYFIYLRIIKSSKKANLNIINIEHKYFSYDSIKESDEESIRVEGENQSSNTTLRGQISTSEFLHEIHEPGVPPHELCLKESAICVLM